MVRAGTAFHSNQKVKNEDDTKIIPKKKTLIIGIAIQTQFITRTKVKPPRIEKKYSYPYN